VDIFGVLRVTWLPRARPPEPDPQVPEQPAPEQPAPEQLAPGVVRELIGLADDLLALAEKAAGPGPRTIGSLQRRVDRLLADCGVRILRDDGPVVASRHEVVGTRAAGADDTEGWIAATIRRGYLHDDQLIRPQLVVAYVAGPPAEHREGIDDEG